MQPMWCSKMFRGIFQKLGALLRVNPITDAMIIAENVPKIFLRIPQEILF